MGEKKNPGRFTLQFNPNDPQQHTVCELLEKQGRHKAQFITNAVLHYINCSETPEIASAPLADLDLIEKMVLEILERRVSENCKPVKSDTSYQCHSIQPAQPIVEGEGLLDEDNKMLFIMHNFLSFYYVLCFVIPENSRCL